MPRARGRSLGGLTRRAPPNPPRAHPSAAPACSAQLMSSSSLASRPARGTRLLRTHFRAANVPEAVVRGVLEAAAAAAAGPFVEDVFCRRRHCPGREPPFSAVKHPVRPYKNTIQNRFTVGNANAA